jgi:hypothetical protein
VVTPKEEEARHVADAEAELEREFPAVPPGRIHTLVHGAWATFANARVRDFVPLLTRRKARETLLQEGTTAPAR